MSEKMTKEQLMQMLPDHPELQVQLNAMTDEDLAEVTAGISLYESSEGINRDSWFVTLLMRILNKICKPGEAYANHETAPSADEDDSDY